MSYNNSDSEQHLEPVPPLKPERTAAKKILGITKKVWTHVAAFGLGLGVILAYMAFYKGIHNHFNPEAADARVSDVKQIIDERVDEKYVADRGTENQVEISLRLMKSLPKGYKRSALELVNTKNFDDALDLYRQGFEEETGNKSITEQEIWRDLTNIAKTISPQYVLACTEGSIRNRSITPSERILYSFDLKSAGQHGKSLSQAKRALTDIDKASQFDLYYRAISAYSHALYENGMYDDALRLYQSAKSELVNRQDSRDNKLSLASALQGLSLMALKSGNFEEAIKYNTEETRIWLELGDYGNFANARSHLGLAALKAQDYDLAEVAFNTALAISLTSDNHNILLGSVQGLAAVYEDIGHENLSYRLARYGAREARRVGSVAKEATFITDLVRYESLKILTKEGERNSKIVEAWMQRLQELSEVDPSVRSYRDLMTSKAYHAAALGNLQEARSRFEKIASIENLSPNDEAWRLGWLVMLDYYDGDVDSLCSRISEYDLIVTELSKDLNSKQRSRLSQVNSFRNKVTCN